MIPADGRYLVLWRATGRGKGSGAVFERRIGQIWTVRDGVGWRVEAYPTLEEARAAAGLD